MEHNPRDNKEIVGTKLDWMGMFSALEALTNAQLRVYRQILINKGRQIPNNLQELFERRGVSLTRGSDKK
jgi:hypothetical protein